MENRKILVVKFRSIDGLATGAVTLREVAALNHEIVNDAVERGALVVQRLPFGANAMLTCAQSSEILGCSWRRLIKELEDQAARDLASFLDVHKDQGHVFPSDNGQS
jgi:hypothetical protein